MIAPFNLSCHHYNNRILARTTISNRTSAFEGKPLGRYLTHGHGHREVDEHGTLLGGGYIGCGLSVNIVANLGAQENENRGIRQGIVFSRVTFQEQI